MYLNRQYVIFNTAELDKIDFSQVLETSADTVRKSVDGTKTFVKWDVTINTTNAESIELINPNINAQILSSETNQNLVFPGFISNLTSAEGPYTHDEMIEILNGAEWNAPRGENL